MSPLFVSLLMALSLGCVFAAVPKCDPKVTSRMSEFHPNGIPKNIIKKLKQNGVYSYVVVSTEESSRLGLRVRCIGIAMPTENTAQVTYKLSIFPKLRFNFPVREENGVLIQKDDKDYKLYVIYLEEGVIFTYRCCDECTATEPNVGIAVADVLRDSATTLKGFATAKAKMAELGLDKDVVSLGYCS